MSERIESFELNSNGNVLSGIISANIIEKGGENYFPKRVLIPFEFAFNVNGDSEYKFTPIIENLNFKFRPDLEFEIQLKVAVTEMMTEFYDVVTDISVGEELQPKTNAISVYIAHSGDSLWNVCKELGAEEDVIMELNPNITFPLSGDERIIIYRNI